MHKVTLESVTLACYTQVNTRTTQVRSGGSSSIFLKHALVAGPSSVEDAGPRGIDIT
jgi:hypothetical protein